MHNLNLLSHLRDSPDLEGQVPVYISPKDWLAQLYPWALGSLAVASYDLQGYSGDILTHLHIGTIYVGRVGLNYS
jgi:hypothetical protein